jgi:hypothetical protein
MVGRMYPLAREGPTRTQAACSLRAAFWRQLSRQARCATCAVCMQAWRWVPQPIGDSLARTLAATASSTPPAKARTSTMRSDSIARPPSETSAPPDKSSVRPAPRACQRYNRRPARVCGRARSGGSSHPTQSPCTNWSTNFGLPLRNCANFSAPPHRNYKNDFGSDSLSALSDGVARHLLENSGRGERTEAGLFQ